MNTLKYECQQQSWIKIGASKLDLGTTIENKTDDIKSDNMKKLTPLILKYQPSHQIFFIL